MLRRFGWGAVMILALLGFPLGESLSAQSVDLLIRGGWVFDVDQGVFQKNTGLAVQGERFVAMPKGEFTAAKTLTLEDDQYLLPGLVDCHAHYNVRLVRRRREEFHVLPATYLANGVTVTFSCGEFDPEGMMALRKRIDAGEQPGPRLINSGPYFGRARPDWRGEKSEDEIRGEVAFWAKQGVGGFKAKGIGPRELAVLIDEAHQHGLTVTGHLDSGYRGSVNPRDAIGMGIDRIEHFLGGDAMPETVSAYTSLPRITADMPEFKAIVNLYVEQGVWFDATITAYGYFGSRGEEYEPWVEERSFFTPLIQQRVLERGPARPNIQFEEIYQAKQRTIKAFHDAGGLISLGTDHFSDGNYLPGFGAHRELDALVRAGIPPADALRIGTLNGARALKIERDHGSIEVGKFADWFVVQGNPLEDIRRTRKVQTVSTRGRLHEAADLLAQVVGKLGPETEDDLRDW